MYFTAYQGLDLCLSLYHFEFPSTYCFDTCYECFTTIATVYTLVEVNLTSFYQMNGPVMYLKK